MSVLTVLDDERGFVINAIFLANLAEVIVFFLCVVQDCVANLLCPAFFMIANYFFEPEAILPIAAVIHTVGVKKNDVSRAHQCDLGYVRSAYLTLPARRGKVFISVRVILGNFQPERRELHELIRIHWHEAPVLRGKNQWWRTAEIYKAEMSVGTYFTVNHGGDFARMVIRVEAQSVPSGDGLRKAEIDVFE
jgi:hypothetical protein